MVLYQFAWNVIDSNSWLLLENSSGLLIDAVFNEELFKEINELEDLTIIITHCHFDHIVGLNKIRCISKKTTVISTKLCSEYVGNPRKNTSYYANLLLEYYEKSQIPNIYIEPFSCKPSDKVFEDTFNYSWNNHKIYLKSVHGHSADSLLAFVDDSYIFTGDTLLSIPTVTRLPGGSTNCFWNEDIPLLKSFDGSMIVYPGHGNPGKLDSMIAINKRPERLKNI